jgi:hypothetical protein
VKVFLSILAAIVVAAGIVAFLAGTLNPFQGLARGKEGLDQAVDRSDGSVVVTNIVPRPPGSPPPTASSLSERFRALLGPLSSRVRDMLGPRPPAPASDPNTVTLTQPVSVRVEYGVVGLAIGTKLHLLSREGDNVRVRYDGADYDIAISATDLKTRDRRQR